MKLKHNNLTLMVLLIAVTSSSDATQLPPTFEATYLITRDGKPTAEQHTKLAQNNSAQYHLTDITKGTHGLASFTGFKRSESTTFELLDEAIKVNQHQMQQKVAFKKKRFSFRTDATTGQINGHYKDDFILEADVRPISPHLLPIWLSTLVCGTNTELTVPVLKSNHIKYYQFKTEPQADDTTLVTRIYPANSDRSTQMWFDQNNHCLPIKTQHQEGDDPLIETTLKAFKFTPLSKP